jgi:hypothetical protein
MYGSFFLHVVHKEGLPQQWGHEQADDDDITMSLPAPGVPM